MAEDNTQAPAPVTTEMSEDDILAAAEKIKSDRIAAAAAEQAAVEQEIRDLADSDEFKAIYKKMDALRPRSKDLQIAYLVSAFDNLFKKYNIEQ